MVPGVIGKSPRVPLARSLPSDLSSVALAKEEALAKGG